MSTIKTKNIQQKVISGTTQPLKIGGIAEDGSDAVLTIDGNMILSGVAINYTATIPSTSWTGSSAPYSKAVTVSGILSTDTPIIDVVQTGVYETDIAILNNWGYLYRSFSSENTITFYATEVPLSDIPIQIKVVR